MGGGGVGVRWGVRWGVGLGVGGGGGGGVDIRHITFTPESLHPIKCRFNICEHAA